MIHPVHPLGQLIRFESNAIFERHEAHFLQYTKWRVAH